MFPIWEVTRFGGTGLIGMGTLKKRTGSQLSPFTARSLIERDAEEERGGEALGIGEVGEAEAGVDGIGQEEEARLGP